MSTRLLSLEMSTVLLSPSHSLKARDEHAATFSGDEHKATFSLSCGTTAAQGLARQYGTIVGSAFGVSGGLGAGTVRQSEAPLARPSEVLST